MKYNEINKIKKIIKFFVIHQVKNTAYWNFIYFLRLLDFLIENQIENQVLNLFDIEIYIHICIYNYSSSSSPLHENIYNNNFRDYYANRKSISSFFNRMQI